MKKRLLFSFAAVGLFIIAGFLPNLWQPTSFDFTVPANTHESRFRGLPPGRYRSREVLWYHIQIGVITDDHNSIVEFAPYNRN